MGEKQNYDAGEERRGEERREEKRRCARSEVQSCDETESTRFQQN
jgi:hypothetical protein